MTYIDFMCSSLVSTIFDFHKKKITSDMFIISLKNEDNEILHNVQTDKNNIEKDLVKTFENIPNGVTEIQINCITTDTKKIVEITSIKVNN